MVEQTRVFASLVNEFGIASDVVNVCLRNGELEVRLPRGQHLFEDEGGVAELLIRPTGIIATSAKGRSVELGAVKAARAAVEPGGMTDVQRSIAERYARGG